ncbi:TetR/AcrR family transcriptional regulator [Bradyrhizobium iriomotense]|uniref:TetR/AcrR family transcriptional regulator n=1 Tax=Bradyrhizobium iriomotense TaxID=441950 RepID=UPI003D665EE6
MSRQDIDAGQDFAGSRSPVLPGRFPGKRRRSVATEANVSKRTLDNYFPSKDDLVVAYLQRRLRPIRASSKGN